MQFTSLAGAGLAVLGFLSAGAAPALQSEFIFPPESWHNHGSCIVELPSGDLLVCWFHGSGERRSDDVRILGARKPSGGSWSKPFEMADTPGFPDTNCCMVLDRDRRLWLLWPTIQANLWESALMNILVSTDYEGREGAPEWGRHSILHMKPGDDFPAVVRRKVADYLSGGVVTPEAIEWGHRAFQQADDKLTRRLGWFTRAHPLVLPDGRLLVGLYSDGFDFSLAAFTDDEGATWGFSEPIVGGGNIQPSFAVRRDGTVVAYMRDNGPPPKRVHVSESRDAGRTWSRVTDHPVLPNPGAGLELMGLADGRFLAVYNDTESGRHSLAVSISGDEGRTWPWTRHLEKVAPGGGSFHYPSVIEGKDGRLHVTYSHFAPGPDGAELKSIRYATFDIDWVLSGDPD